MTLRSELRERLQAVRRRWFIAVWLQICARILVSAALIVGAAALADRWIAPGSGALLLLAVAALAAVIAAVVLAAWPHRHRPDDLRVARFVEERRPELDDALATAVDLSRRDGTAEAQRFAPLVVANAVTRLRELDPSSVIETHTLTSAARRTGFAAAACVVAVIVALPFAGRVMEVARLRYLPASITLAVEPGDLRIPIGRPLTIVARLSDRTGPLRHAAPMLTIEANGQKRSVAMEPRDHGYEVRINAVDRSFGYRIQAGSVASRPYSVTALVPPRVKRIDLRYEYPEFARLAPYDEQNGGDVFGPAGTRVRLRVTTDKPVANGRLAMSDGPGQPLARVGDRTLESTITLSADASYRVSLTDADGLASDGTEYFIRLMDDRPPEVHLLRPMGDQQITPLEEVTIEARADDDYGIASFDLVYSVAGGRERVVPFSKVAGTDVAKVGSRLIAAEDLNVKPGDVVSYYARARDVARGKQSTLARSEIFFLEVKPFNEEYALAQSQAMAAATGTQLESLIAAQKEIISATWNLERRSSAGRSSSDIKAVADAQAELKARAEQASGAMRPRRRMLEPPEQLAPAQGSGNANPIVDAVAAMTRAQQQLEGRRTSEAIPHEMAALTALLKAEAEVRRRQITQQANGASSAGNGRQGQDLSSLFDRELKRQQRTNYETRSQIEERPDQNNDASALDRIRELARRQEELNRQQRDLAGSEMTAEELKRELEKLTREQMELRQQAEDLTKRMKQDGNQGAQGARGAQGAQGAAEQLTKAMEQMRGAAGDLRRDDAASATNRGEQAARELRNLERQLQSASPDARRRALGELQLESQQLAEAQRRVANEAGQLDREGGGTADARRRLSSEKEDLADRVEKLREAARRLSSDTKAAAADRAAMTEAGTELDRQRIAERMRAGARDMRDDAVAGGRTASPKPLAGSERQLADAMDRVARRMNGADAGGATGDAQRLADNLEQARDARDRLAQIEKQMHDQQLAAQPSGRGGRTGAQGRQGQNGAQGDGQGSDMARLRDEYARELQRTRDLLNRLQRGTPDSGRNMSTPEQHEWSRSAPGTEAWKQDYGKWQSLSSDVKQALERYESGAAERLSRALTADRLRGGGSDRVPDAYQRRIARYFESLAKR